MARNKTPNRNRASASEATIPGEAVAGGDSECSECQAALQPNWKVCPECGTPRNSNPADGGDKPQLPSGWYLGPNGEICTGTSCVKAEKTPDGKFIVRIDPNDCDPEFYKALAQAALSTRILIGHPND